MAKYTDSLNKLFTALSDPTRRSVIDRLGSGPASVSELAVPYEMALPSFVQHLKILEDCGFIRTKKQGRVRTCTLNPKSLQEAEKWITERRIQWEHRIDSLEDYLEKSNKDKEK